MFQNLEISPNLPFETPNGVAPEVRNGSPEIRWQQELAAAIRSPKELFCRLGLPAEPLAEAAQQQFPVLVPESYLARMESGNPRDPLLLQVLPLPPEDISEEGFSDDPVGDQPVRTAPGLLHKYAGRALLITTGQCAVHCRYCFRRHYAYDQEPKSIAAWEPAFEAIRNDSSLHEILLSGGDPLVLSDRRLQQLWNSLEAISHVRRIRIHSRLPIVLPSRITQSLLDLFTQGRLRSIFVVHANHAQELQADCADALQQLVAAGIPVMNQAVLLKDVNDSVEALAELCERCIDLGVMPYYLHQLDRVQGAAHFEVPVDVGRQLIRDLRRRLPGYAVPRYVIEQAGEASKTPIE